jgi:hypothetical protein
MGELAEWDTFYVIVGSATGALIGLQFVVVTLIADKPGLRSAEAGAAFATPTIVHFCAALLLSALLRAPWHTTAVPATLWGLVGLAGAIYVLIVAWRMRRQTAYRPVIEDWLLQVGAPFAAYAMLVGSAFAAIAHPREALFAVGASVLLLLFIGIHHAWDAITYHVFIKMGDKD